MVGGLYLNKGLEAGLFNRCLNVFSGEEKENLPIHLHMANHEKHSALGDSKTEIWEQT